MTPAGGVLVQVERRLVVAGDLARALPARAAGAATSRYGRAKARADAGAPIRRGVEHQRPEGLQPERPRHQGGVATTPESIGAS